LCEVHNSGAVPAEERGDQDVRPALVLPADLSQQSSVPEDASALAELVTTFQRRVLESIDVSNVAGEGLPESVVPAAVAVLPTNTPPVPSPMPVTSHLNSVWDESAESPRSARSATAALYRLLDRVDGVVERLVDHAVSPFNLSDRLRILESEVFTPSSFARPSTPHVRRMASTPRPGRNADLEALPEVDEELLSFQSSISLEPPGSVDCTDDTVIIPELLVVPTAAELRSGNPAVPELQQQVREDVGDQPGVVAVRFDAGGAQGFSPLRPSLAGVQGVADPLPATPLTVRRSQVSYLILLLFFLTHCSPLSSIC